MTYLGKCVDASDGEIRVVAIGDDTIARAVSVASIAELLALPRAEILSRVGAATEVVVAAEWLPPVDGKTEVWAAGVTYLRSRDARTEESNVPDVYTRVYQSERPELFFKSVSWKVVTNGEAIGIREDSPVNVPEPEVAVMVTSLGEILGFTICNDVSSRSIEGENPLYLPQAKVYSRACAVHKWVRLLDEGFDPNDLDFEVEILRSGATLWQASASTSQLNRGFEELVGWLYRGSEFPEGALLSTGTCLVPDLNTTLLEGDVVRIHVSELGELINHVVRGLAAPASQPRAA